MRSLIKLRLQNLFDQGNSLTEIVKIIGYPDPNIIFYLIRMYGIQTKPKIRKSKEKIKMITKCVGLDIGTSTIISARKENEQIIIKTQRNAFLKLPGDKQTQHALKRLSVNYIKLKGDHYIVGDDAFNYAHVFPSTNLRRPMASGMLNPAEPDAFPILQALIHNLLGNPKIKNETCFYSVPSPPMDTDKLIEYHSDIVGEIILSLGYKAEPLNEGFAVGILGLENYNRTGLALCFGAGLANAAILYKGLSALQISVTKAGDFIDKNASQDTGTPEVHITTLKESGKLDISKEQTTREGQAIKSYYMYVIRYVLKNLLNKFNYAENMPHFTEPIAVVCAGGGVLIKGFAEIFKQEFEAVNMPFILLENGIKIMSNPLTTVARGCLAEALIDE